MSMEKAELAVVPSVAEADPGLAIAEAAQLLEREKTARAEACLAEIKSVLKQFGCVILPVHTFEGSQLQSGIRVVAQ